MIDLVLVRFLRDHTPHKAGDTAAFSPTAAENFKRARVAEIVGPLKEEVKAERKKIEK